MLIILSKKRTKIKKIKALYERFNQKRVDKTKKKCYNVAMSYTDRKKQILSLFEQSSSVSVDSLTKILYASPATVRRDLARLEEEGLIIRSHGKAVRINQSADGCVPYAQRVTVGSPAKKRIAESAASDIVKDGAVIMLDASSTTLQMVEHMKGYSDLIVITSGILTLVELMKTGVRFYSTGGRAINESSSFVGQTAIETLKTFNADVCFVSCHGVSEDGFVTDTSERENDIRAAMMKQSKRKVLLIDDSKIGISCWHNLCRVSDFDDVFCNVPLPDNIMKGIRNFHLI